MKVIVKIAFRCYVVGQTIPDLPDNLARAWIKRNLVEEFKEPAIVSPKKKGR